MALPALPENHNWSGNVHTAYEIISSACGHAEVLLSQEGSDALRYQQASEPIMHDALPLLEAMEINEDGLSEDWFSDVADALGDLVRRLSQARDASAGQ